MLFKTKFKYYFTKNDGDGPMAFVMPFTLPKDMGNKFIRSFMVPFVAFLLFLGIWGGFASQIVTSLGEVPGPKQVWEQTINLYNEHNADSAVGVKMVAVTNTGWCIENHCGHEDVAGETPFLFGAAGVYVALNYAAGVRGTASGYLLPAVDS